MIIISSMVILALIMIGILIVWYYNKDSYILKLRNDENWDLKSSYELTQGLSVITLYQGSKGYNFIVDTGSNRNHIASGCGIEGLLSNQSVDTYGITAEKIQSRLAKITMYYNKSEYTFEVLVGTIDSAFNEIKKETGVTVHGLLGSSFLKQYDKIIDYKNLMVHTAK